MSKNLRMALVLGGVLLTVACAEQQPAVQRIGNDILDKSAFEGEWYYLQTVIDTPYAVPYTFVGEQSLLERITWDIQERYLIVRRAYEYVSGSEGEGIAGAASEQGAPIAMFPITSHFDVRRTYNTITGEEENVVVENDTDRPWEQRQFMRVDWSQNMISEGEFLVYARVFDGMELEPVAYHINDPSHPDAPRYGFTPEGAMNYLDVVNRVLVRPTEVEIDGYAYPTCWLESQTHTDCAPAELSVRHSFRRIDADEDYQPVDYSGDRMERFGYFVTERAGYDPHYGAVEPARRRWLNRHDLWQRSYRRDADEQVLRCRDDVDCEDGMGSACDAEYGRARGEGQGACTIAYRERIVSPIAYHLSRNFPEDLRQTTEAIAEDWNTALRDTVGSLRALECERFGGDAESCEAERSRADASDVFVLCSNPVVETDHAECGALGTEARIGDLRYSLLAWVPEPHMGSPLGYGPSSADPITGELVQASAFVYGAGIEELATMGRDLVAALNGDLAESEIMDSEHVAQWVNRNASERRALPGRDVHRVDAAIDLSRITGGRRARGDRRARSRDLPALRTAAVRRLNRRGAFGHAGRARGRLDALRDTAVEAMLTSPALSAAAGVDPNLPTGDAFYESASPLRGLSLRARRARASARRTLMRERCVLRAADFADEGLAGLARAIKRAATSGDGSFEWYGQRFQLGDGRGNVDYDAVRRMLRHPILRSTAAHEVGHTLGLRHNFAASYDALNYHPTYWQLRDDGDMQARPWDPISENEIEGRQREFQYASVMDYGHNYLVTDAAGLGHYDRAAIKMGYGDLVEVFDGADESLELSWIYFQQLFGWPGPLTYASFFGDNPITAHHYTDLPALVGGVDGLEARSDVPYTSLQAHPTLASDDGIEMPLVDAQGRPSVPYRFCSDETADISPECQLYDAGADDYESIQSIIDAYWNYYVFRNFRRGRLGFDDLAHYDDVYFGFFSKLQSANQVYVYNRSFLEEIFGAEGMGEFWTSRDGLATSTLAVGQGYELLRRVITAPEPGSYVRYTMANGAEAYLPDEWSESELTVDPLDGRYLETTWDFDAGYFWFDQLDRVGFFVDKVVALQTLVDPETWLLGQDTEADVRGFQVNFASAFGDSVYAFLSGILSENYTAIGPRVTSNGLRYPDALEIVDESMIGVPIDPNTDFSVQLYAASFGMAWIPLTYDDAFFESARIYAVGSAEAVSLPARERVEFQDPFTSLRYVAGSYIDDDSVERGIGARMLLHAADLQAAGEDSALDLYMDLIRFQRSLSWIYGFEP